MKAPRAYEEFLRQLLAAAGPEAEEEIMSVVDWLEEKGRLKGLEEGHEEGRAERQRSMRLKLLRLRSCLQITDIDVAPLSVAGARLLELWTELAAGDATPRRGTGVPMKPESEEKFTSVAHWLEERGRLKGLEDARRENQEEVRIESQRRVLLKLLRDQFGALPETEVARIGAASAEKLDLWTERLIIATTLAEVLGEE